jgi:hypothetical protein
MSGRTQPLGWTDKEDEMKANNWHSAQGTVKELASILTSIADGVMLDPVSRDHHGAALVLQHRASNARTHKDIALAAVSAAFCFKQVGDFDTEGSILALMEGRS